MKLLFKLFVLILVVSDLALARQASADLPKLTGPYLGQKPPGMIPELFAPGIISLGYHEHRIAISPDGTEIYFPVFGNEVIAAKIMFTRLENGNWSTPCVAPFSDKGLNLHPSFSPDGKQLYFTSTRPVDENNTKRNRADIWYVERIDNSWSQPIHMGDEVNTSYNESCPTIMADGTLFFESIRNDVKNLDIYFSVLKNGIRQNAEKLENPVNTENGEGSPFVAPDESYMLFSSNRPGTLGEHDIYVTFKDKSGGWGEPVNLGNKINSVYLDWTPIVTPDGKYLIFSSYRNTDPIVPVDAIYSEKLKKEIGLPKTGNGTFYWVSATIIEELKPQELK